MTHKQGSTARDHQPAEMALRAGTPTSPAVWRSVDEFAQTPAFREIVEREFPAGASELAGSSRRDFVKLMGASLALAGAATIPGCRRPDHKILTYSQIVPENIIPGKPLFYATSVPLPGGGAEGLLVETHEGRPTKVEGNPLHPNNRGRCSPQALASPLTIYDPDRLKFPVYDNPAKGKVAASWDDFALWSTEHFAQYAGDGSGLAFLVEPRSTPAWEATKAKVQKRYPNARWVSYLPAGSDAANEGSQIAFGQPMREVFDFGKARVVVALDRDFTEGEAGAIANARGFGASRRVWKSTDSMCRLYAVEPSYSGLGGLADHHVRLAPSQIPAFTVALAKAVLGSLNDAPLRAAVEAITLPDTSAFDSLPTETKGKSFVQLLAEDLLAAEHLGHSLIAVGKTQPAAIHALVHALNAALGNTGSTVRYIEQTGDLAAPVMAGLRSLTSEMASGSIKTIVCVNVNPVFDAPADLGFADAFAKVPARVCLSVGKTETSEASTWALNGAHWLESWSDTVANDGTIAPTQPMIAPLYEPAKNDIELLALLAGDEAPDGFAIVQQAWAKALGMQVVDGGFGKVWKRALRDGFLPDSGGTMSTPKVRTIEVSRALGAMTFAEAPAQGALDVVFTTGSIGDGRDANNAWLQEMPHHMTKVVWDNPVVVSPATARALDLEPDSYEKKRQPHARMATLRVGGRSMELPVWICPGMADNVAVVTLGYGRTTAGVVGDGVGFNTYALRAADQGALVRSGTLARTGKSYPISSTQNHWSLEGRYSLARWLDKPAWETHAAKAEAGPTHGRVEDPFDTSGDDGALSVAEKLGELTHTPANLSLYENPMNEGRGNPVAGSEYSKGLQWGMTIDMASCTGCNACTIACQSENNIPVVGKKEVAKGREMQWIRIDRYFVGDSLDEPDRVINQPLGCTQCENAPCETVCPVTATVHDREGLNVMAYNRCIGTRYCMNNCPYKARRFNFFDWAQTKTNGGLDPSYVPESIRNATDNGGQGSTFNQNLIPPRLLAKLDEVQKMKQNPNVTVRGRGVMEKCTYCLQRINSARAGAKVQGLDTIPDGYFQVACEQACPTESIVFGDILKPDSRVSNTRTSQRSYMLLGFLNVRPRTSHLMRVTNPNPAITAPVDTIAAHGGGHGGDHGDDHGDDTHSAPADDHSGETHSFRVDPRRRLDDDGYALSLNVLGTGVHL
ncbi:Molybdopterin oxidoreductase, iron-sulfur binding subunit [hydrothermal vent metagenome]|uniref:Molybdopterin oxidoreductase, iron-sulfur binding subunit n=1 Tax=hydrothermal vent metagenome TaxID=652676 RepID=A0A3B1DH47_9ZZZZ